MTALGAIAYVHALRGTAIPWIDDWTASPPTAVSFETGGLGDDISLTLPTTAPVEVQAKKGLTAAERFWSALDSLCEGIDSERGGPPASSLAESQIPAYPRG